MKKHQFYNTKFKSIDKKEFIKVYSEIYFHYNNYNVEKEIKNYLKEGNEKNWHNIFAWKLGKTKSILSLEEIENLELKLRTGNALDLDKIRFDGVNKEIISKFDECFSKNNIDWEKVEELLKEIVNTFSKIKGIGSTYIITILYFLTNGICPIYDRFANMALIAYENNIKPWNYLRKGDKKLYKEIPSKDNSKVISYYIEYWKKLIAIFGKNNYSSRKIDQALWTYGHMFKE